MQSLSLYENISIVYRFLHVVSCFKHGDREAVFLNIGVSKFLDFTKNIYNTSTFKKRVIYLLVAEVGFKRNGELGMVAHICNPSTHEVEAGK